MPTSAPTSQRERPISFVLDNQVGASGPIWVPLVVRPEDLTVREPVRMAVHHTMGLEEPGWVDNFGMGLPTVTIAGHTGWRAAAGQSRDGAAQFDYLRQNIVEKYHEFRRAAISAGADPALVKLMFVDELDKLAYEVDLVDFVLRRSKSRPLLMQYNIQLQVVNPRAVAPVKAGRRNELVDVFSGLGSFGAALKSIQNTINSIVKNIRAFIGPVADAVNSFVRVVVAVCTAVRSVVSAVVNGVRSIANDLISIARSLAVGARNVFATLQSIVNLPNDIKHSLGRVKSAFNEIACILKNSLKPARRYQNYSDLYGASNCSSTTGGRSASQLAETNVFYDLQPQNNPVIMSNEAQASVGALASSDPVTAPMSIGELARHMGNVNSGYGGVSPDYAASVNSVAAGTLR